MITLLPQYLPLRVLLHCFEKSPNYLFHRYADGKAPSSELNQIHATFTRLIPRRCLLTDLHTSSYVSLGHFMLGADSPKDSLELFTIICGSGRWH